MPRFANYRFVFREKSVTQYVTNFCVTALLTALCSKKVCFECLEGKIRFDILAQTLCAQIITASSCIYVKCKIIGRNKFPIARVFEEHVSENTVRFYSFRLVLFRLVLQNTVSPLVS